MKAKTLVSLFIFFLASTRLEANEVTGNLDVETAPLARSSQVSVEDPAFDTEGLVDASRSLAGLIDQLTASIEHLGADNGALSTDDRALLVSFVKSADQASQAVARLADQWPQIVSSPHEPIAEVSTGFDVTITESMLVKFFIYSMILLVVPAVIIVAITWFAYKRYVSPLKQKLDALVAAPEHLENMSRHMQQTSSNLLALQAKSEKSHHNNQLGDC